VLLSSAIEMSNETTCDIKLTGQPENSTLFMLRAKLQTTSHRQVHAQYVDFNRPDSVQEILCYKERVDAY